MKQNTVIHYGRSPLVKLYKIYDRETDGREAIIEIGIKGK